MRIPSYDDLTPSIPDVPPQEVLASVSRLLPRHAASPETGPRPSTHTEKMPDYCPTAGLFACLRSPRMADVIVGIARDFSPRFERHGGDSVVLDVSGLGRLLGSPEAIGTELAGMAATREHADIHVAVAPTQVSALLLSLTGAALTIVTANEAAALAPLPVQLLGQLMAGIHGETVLRRRGVAPRRAAIDGGANPLERERPNTIAAPVWPAWPSCGQAFGVLQRWGVQTLGELAALPPADLSARMGQDGVALQRLARGVDPRPLVPDPDVPRFLERMELEWPVDGLEPLSFVLARLLEPLSSALERADRAAAAIRLDLRLVDRAMHRRMLQLPAAMRDPKVLRTLLLLDLESHPPSEAIDIVAIEIDPAPGRVIQYSLLERAMPSAETIATLTARLGALAGEFRCGSPDVLDTHRPDGFAMRRFAPAFARSNQARIGEASPGHPARSGPAGRESGRVAGICLRRFRPPVAVRVRIDRGRPAHVSIDRRGMPGGGVVQAAGPWRSSGAWWSLDTLPWDRDEWDVELSDGSVCLLFREHDTWFLDGVID